MLLIGRKEENEKTGMVGEAGMKKKGRKGGGGWW